MERVKLDLDREVHYNLKYMGMRFSQETTDALNRFLFDGLPPGGHLEAMFAYDFERALYNADTHNRTVFWGIAMWIRDHAPAESQGSYTNVNIWCTDDMAPVREAFRVECEKKSMWQTLEKA